MTPKSKVVLFYADDKNTIIKTFSTLFFMFFFLNNILLNIALEYTASTGDSINKYLIITPLIETIQFLFKVGPALIIMVFILFKELNERVSENLNNAKRVLLIFVSLILFILMNLMTPYFYNISFYDYYISSIKYLLNNLTNTDFLINTFTSILFTAIILIAFAKFDKTQKTQYSYIYDTFNSRKFIKFKDYYHSIKSDNVILEDSRLHLINHVRDHIVKNDFKKRIALKFYAGWKHWAIDLLSFMLFLLFINVILKSTVTKDIVHYTISCVSFLISILLFLYNSYNIPLNPEYLMNTYSEKFHKMIIIEKSLYDEIKNRVDSDNILTKKNTSILFDSTKISNDEFVILHWNNSLFREIKSRRYLFVISL